MPEAHGSGVVLSSLAHATYQENLNPLECLTPTRLRVTVRRGLLSQEHGQVSGNWIRRWSRAGAEAPQWEPDSAGRELLMRGQRTAHARAVNCTCAGRKSLSFQNQCPETPEAATSTAEAELWSPKPSQPPPKGRKPDSFLTCPSSRSVFKYITLLKFPQEKALPHIVLLKR